MPFASILCYAKSTAKSRPFGESRQGAVPQTSSAHDRTEQRSQFPCLLLIHFCCCRFFASSWSSERRFELTFGLTWDMMRSRESQPVLPTTEVTICLLRCFGAVIGSRHLRLFEELEVKMLGRAAVVVPGCWTFTTFHILPYLKTVAKGTLYTGPKSPRSFMSRGLRQSEVYQSRLLASLWQPISRDRFQLPV